MASPSVHKPVYLPVGSKLGTEPVSPDDDKSHAVLYRYPLAVNGSNAALVDVSAAIPRMNVLDFFYPHKLGSGETLELQKMRRDLFLLAFQAVQALDSTDPWSYYQIAAIHGLPHQPYDGDVSDWDDKNPDWWGGYCQHGTPLFPTWHRPYTMLLEQSIIRQAKVVASSLSDTDEKAAALNIAPALRFPFWDWADQSSRVLGLPDIFLSTEATLWFPWKSMSITSIPNPLKAFVVPENVGKPLSSSDVYNPTAKPNYVVPSRGIIFTPQSYPTVRHTNAQYLSQNDKLNVYFIRNANTVLVEGLQAVFQHNKWLPFSNHFWSEETHGDHSDFGHYASIELVHDFVHDIIGGLGGHMAYPEVAAFDPIFFFHHVNVDRLIALWQYCYPNSWIPQESTQLNSEGTYTDKPNSQALATTPLMPFRRSNERINSFVSSNDVKLVDADCGFSYPEILQARKEDWEPYKMLEYVMKLYKPPVDFECRWILVVDRIVKRAFDGSFMIRVFIDKNDANCETPTSVPNFAGEIQIFARASGVWCANCEKQKYMRGSLDLTKTMVRLGLNVAPDVDEAGKLPLKDPGAITLVFVTLQNQQLDPFSALGTWDGPKVSLYYQKGIIRENIKKHLVDGNIDINPEVICKFDDASLQLVIAKVPSKG